MWEFGGKRQRTAIMIHDDIVGFEFSSKVRIKFMSQHEVEVVKISCSLVDLQSVYRNRRLALNFRSALR